MDNFRSYIFPLRMSMIQLIPVYDLDSGVNKNKGKRKK